VLAANLLDLIPNATLTNVTMLFAGALAGRLELARAGNPVPGSAESEGARASDVAPARPGAAWVPSPRPGVAGVVAGATGRGAQYSRFTPRRGRNER
jgi:hypothetical protein